MKTWKFPQPTAVPPALRSAVGGHPLVAETLARRGIVDPAAARAFLDPSAYTSSSPLDLPGMGKAIDRLARAIRDHEPVCVWGDFDVDGQTASALLVSTLRELGGTVSYHIPVREQESHGLNIPVLSRIVAEGVRLILTCDTGIHAHEAVLFAQARGVDMIVTDHHLPGETLPAALAVVNPHLAPPGHPANSLPGVGVAYKLASALYRAMGSPGGETQYLDLAALGIVADLALVKADTRHLLQLGLSALRRTTRPGLLAMLELAEIDPAGLTEEHVGFELGPRLNALGRLSDANPAVDLLTTRDPGQARVIAAQLEVLNSRRRLLTSQVYQAAVELIERDPSLLRSPALVLSHPVWPAGVIGIVASRLVEEYSRPVALIAAPPGDLARGSARSIAGVDITAAIAACREHLTDFGGHPMAGGFALHADRVPAFRDALSAAVGEQLAALDREPALPVDGWLPLDELSPELVVDLERLAPFGPGNPRPVLVAKNLSLENRTSLGRAGEHLLVTVSGESGNSHKIVWWGGGVGELPDWLVDGVPFELAYTARSSDTRGRQEVQIEWVDARPVEGEDLKIQPRRSIRVEDYRGADHPLAVLKDLLKQGDLVVWAEGVTRERLAEKGIQGIDRVGLTPHRRLAVWTSPPGTAELQTALDAVSPEIVFLFAVDPEEDGLEPFLLRLAGLVKYTLRVKAGRTSLSALATATAQREPAVRVGLAWLEASGQIGKVSVEGDEVVFGEKRSRDRVEMDRLAARLHTLLAETAAFRAYYARADTGRLIEVL